MKQLFFYIIIFLPLNTRAMSQALKSSTKVISETNQNSQYDSLQRFISNRTLASGLTSGAKSINRTVDTVMESIFYSIMDQSFSTKLTPLISLNTNFTRDVNETASGTYVIIDRFRLGPEFKKEIAKIGSTPIDLGSSSNLFITNIYHRSNPIRAYERETLPLWRNLFNHWFGILPLIANIMPPSFNLEELYDPITYASTPLLAPTNADSALNIPIGSIRKYGISGGLNLAIEPLRNSLSRLSEDLDSDTIDIKLPISLFKTGEHTISVFRKSEHIFWVLVTDSRSTGTRVESVFSNAYKVLSKLIPQWGGVNAPISPIDVLFSKARVSSIDQLYTFDFRFAAAKKAYEFAAKGNLARAYEIYSNQDRKKMGITFEFNKITYSNQKGSQRERNFFVQQVKNANQHTISEIEIFDSKSQTNILEAEQTLEHFDWDVLVGIENIKMRNRVELKVIKGKNHSKSQPDYRFDRRTKSPINIFSSLQISDRFNDAKEFQKSMELIRYYLTNPLKNVPHIPVYSNQRILEQKLQETLRNPMDNIYRIKVSPTHLGKLTLNARISFPSEFLKRMSNKKPFQIRRAMAIAYGLDANYWSQKNIRKKWSWILTYLGWGTMQPLKLLNIQIPAVEFINETSRTVDAVKKLKEAISPMEYLSAFGELFDSPYPTQLVRALSLLGNYRILPKSLSFTTSPKYQPKDTKDITAAKKLFGSLNRLKFRTGKKFPKSFTFRSIERKIASFNPDNYIDDRKKIRLSKISIIPRVSKKKVEYAVELGINTLKPKKSLYVYIRFEQSGSVNFGRFVLFDQVTKLDIYKTKGKEQAAFFLNGKMSPFGTTISDFVIELGGSFNLKLSLSDDGQNWSEPTLVQIKLSDIGAEIL